MKFRQDFSRLLSNSASPLACRARRSAVAGRLCLSLVLGFALLFLTAPRGAIAQVEDLKEEPEISRTTRISIADANAVPGEQFTVPVYFTPAFDSSISKLKFQITFVSANLKLLRLDPGIIVDLGNLRLTHEVKSAKNDKDVESTTVSVAAEMPAGGSSGEGIMRGLLAFLVLQVREEGRPAIITLRVSGEATDLKTGKPVDNFEETAAKVQVFAPGDRPVVSCFFFTH